MSPWTRCGRARGGGLVGDRPDGGWRTGGRAGASLRRVGVDGGPAGTVCVVNGFSYLACWGVWRDAHSWRSCRARVGAAPRAPPSRRLHSTAGGRPPCLAGPRGGRKRSCRPLARPSPVSAACHRSVTARLLRESHTRVAAAALTGGRALHARGAAQVIPPAYGGDQRLLFHSRHHPCGLFERTAVAAAVLPLWRSWLEGAARDGGGADIPQVSPCGAVVSLWHGGDGRRSGRRLHLPRTGGGCGRPSARRTRGSRGEAGSAYTA